MALKVSNYLYQTENTLLCKKDCKLIINKDDYEIENSLNIYEDEGIIWVKSLVSYIEFNDVRFNIILDYTVNIKITNIKKDKNKIIIEYKANDEILEAPLEKQELKEQVLYLQRLIGGREVFKDINHLLLKLYKIYKPIASDMDLVHLEILLSQCLRDRNNMSNPSRLSKNPEEASLQNLKTNIFTSGFLQGLAFENVGKAIKTGLITDKKLEQSIIEKILTGTIIERQIEEE